MCSHRVDCAGERIAVAPRFEALHFVHHTYQELAAYTITFAVYALGRLQDSRSDPGE